MQFNLDNLTLAISKVTFNNCLVHLTIQRHEWLVEEKANLVDMNEVWVANVGGCTVGPLTSRESWEGGMATIHTDHCLALDWKTEPERSG